MRAVAAAAHKRQRLFLLLLLLLSNICVYVRHAIPLFILYIHRYSSEQNIYEYKFIYIIDYVKKKLLCIYLYIDLYGYLCI